MCRAGCLCASTFTCLPACLPAWLWRGQQHTSQRGAVPAPPTLFPPLCLRTPFCLCSLGTLESTKAVYECILDLRIATPQLVLNYAAMMNEHKFFEEAFRYVCVWCVCRWVGG